jgi:hypothetical protein
MTLKPLFLLALFLVGCPSSSEKAPPAKAASNGVHESSTPSAVSQRASAPTDPSTSATTPAPATPDINRDLKAEPWLTFERGPCFGICPVYTVHVFDDGLVEYDGQRLVKETGKRTKTLSAAEMQELRTLFADKEFRALNPDCCNCRDITDASSATIELRDGATPKKIHHYHGCRTAPSFLQKIELSIDRIIATEAWFGTTAERLNLFKNRKDPPKRQLGSTGDKNR